MENRRLGSFVAEVRIPEHARTSVRWERTIPANPGHYTLWGDPDELLGYVVHVERIEEHSHG